MRTAPIPGRPPLPGPGGTAVDRRSARSRRRRLPGARRPRSSLSRSVPIDVAGGASMAGGPGPAVAWALPRAPCSGCRTYAPGSASPPACPPGSRRRSPLAGDDLARIESRGSRIAAGRSLLRGQCTWPFRHVRIAGAMEVEPRDRITRAMKTASFGLSWEACEDAGAAARDRARRVGIGDGAGEPRGSSPRRHPADHGPTPRARRSTRRRTADDRPRRRPGVNATESTSITFDALKRVCEDALAMFTDAQPRADRRVSSGA